MDKRIIKTKAALRKGIIDILYFKPLAKVTVKELCDKSCVNRSTFYTYYKGPTELFCEMRDCFMHGILETAQESMQTPTPVRSIVSLVEEHKDYSKLLIDNAFFSEDLTNVIKLFEINICNRLRTNRHVPDKEIKYMFLFLTNGVIGLLRAWLRNELVCTSEELALMAEKFVMKATENK